MEDPKVRVSVGETLGTYISEIPDGAVLAISGFNMATTPEFLIKGLYERYKSTGHPKSLFVETDALPASPERGLDAVYADMYKRDDFEFIRGLLIPFLGFSPWMQKATLENKVAVYGWPIGVTVYWFRETASGRPGLLSSIGIDTFLDPRRDGGAMNLKARDAAECRITLMSIDGKEYLLFQAPKPSYALIRATSSDSSGNLTMEDEAIRGTVLSIAQATKAMPGRGKVIAQVKRIVENGVMNPRQVEVPFPLVDEVIVSPSKYHWQSSSFEYDPRATLKLQGDVIPDSVYRRMEEGRTPSQEVIARKVLVDLVEISSRMKKPILVNLGVGIPAAISGMLESNSLSSRIVTVVESGPWGGIALPGVDFGVSLGAFALSTIPDMFSNYEGGIIDSAVLGFLQIDSHGNVNSSYLPTKLTGPGGFPVIAGGAPKTYFAGAFTAGKSIIEVSTSGLNIREDGKILKFVNEAQKVFFSGREALRNGRDILYVTERASFSLSPDGLILKEIAPGVDLERDVLKKMEFTPKVSSDLKEYDPRLFTDRWKDMIREKMDAN